MEKNVTEQDLIDFVAKLQIKLTVLAVKNQSSADPIITYQMSKVNARLVLTLHGGRSCYGFVSLATGDLLKADGWKGPAKGTRGNIFADNPLAGCNEYGMIYFR